MAPRTPKTAPAALVATATVPSPAADVKSVVAGPKQTKLSFGAARAPPSEDPPTPKRPSVVHAAGPAVAPSVQTPAKPLAKRARRGPSIQLVNGATSEPKAKVAEAAAPSKATELPAKQPMSVKPLAKRARQAPSSELVTAATDEPKAKVAEVAAPSKATELLAKPAKSVQTPAKRARQTPSVQPPIAATETDEPTAKVAEVTVPSKAPESSRASELKVGDVSYSCLTTCDPKAAAAWAKAVQVAASAGAAPDSSALGVLGLDCEWAAAWHRPAGSKDRLATLQLFYISAGTGALALVFSLAGLDELPEVLNEVLGDKRIAKIGANVAGDASRLLRDFGCAVRGLYDLSKLNQEAGGKLRRSVSLEDVVQKHCPESMHISKSVKAMEKGVRTSNWESWPLSEDQIFYAASDVALSVMAFMYRFGIDLKSPCLSPQAIQALSDLEETVSPAQAPVKEAKAKDATAAVKKRPSAALAATEENDDENEENEIEKKASDHSNFFMAMRNSSVKPPNIGKKQHPRGGKNALAGVCIVVSGCLDSFERKDMEKYVQDHGGKVSKAVTAKVTHLVHDHGEAGPSKLAKCKELGIPCVSEDVILELVAKSVAAGGA